MTREDGRVLVWFPKEARPNLEAVQRDLREREALHLSLAEVARYLADIGFAHKTRNSESRLSSATN